jgi:AcrR family transcriptional regulator
MTDLADPWSAVRPAASRRMVLAAIDAFAERGYHATTTRDIAGRAGLSPAALYVHYPSKAALLAEISRTGHEAALALVERSLRDAGDGPVERLHRVVRDFVVWHAEHHRVARVVQYELAALPEDAADTVADLRRRIEALVQGEIVAGVQAGQMDVADPRGVARAILSLCVDVSRWFDPRGRERAGSIATLYADLALRMVGAGMVGAGMVGAAVHGRPE